MCIIFKKKMLLGLYCDVSVEKDKYILVDRLLNYLNIDWFCIYCVNVLMYVYYLYGERYIIIEI